MSALGRALFQTARFGAGHVLGATIFVVGLVAMTRYLVNKNNAARARGETP